jgi:hypothetical protein
MNFVRARGFSLAVVVLVMFLITVSQAGISYSIELGPLQKFESTTARTIAAGLYELRVVLLLLLATLWVLNRKRGLFRSIIAANIYFTLALLVDVIALLRVLGGLQKVAPTLLIDAALMSLSNMLVFSIWYLDY